MQYLALIFYVINTVYAFTYHNVLEGFLNLIIPYAFLWDFMMK